MKKLLVIDGNSIINRAFYGIMTNRMLMTEDGIYTNAIYGFLTILFKELEEIKPEYLVVAFDLKAPTHRHKLYKEYKANRQGMPNELAMQMPILKEILQAMNICIIEKEGYEADDVLGTLAKWGQSQKLETTILTGDRDSFQLVDKLIKVRMPRTKQGKTETRDYGIKEIKEEYGLEPKELIEVKGIQGDTADNIPGVSGIGEKTALKLIKEYKTIDNLYDHIDEQKGKLKERLEQNKELAYLSRTLGTIDIQTPIEKDLTKFEVVEWDKEKVLEIFKKLRFTRFIEKFSLSDESNINKEKLNIEYQEMTEENINQLKQEIEETNVMFYYIEKDNLDNNICIVDKHIKELSIYSAKENKAYYTKNFLDFKDIFENKKILKCGYKQKEDWILLKNGNIVPQNLMFDIEIAGYLLNSSITKYSIEYLSSEYLRN